MVFDADELGLDPEDDDQLLLKHCPDCGELIEDCECEEEEMFQEDDDAAIGF